ncbi:hypothetical protein NDU88_008224 [Pleurodeles waltl]|uniref:Uncharacterized protein n=1 Tax=Pleurodeles waltl TaxID=8319 RepID=A0AAV7VVV1_PLEWA|nr:hypothetical protein NDU88_008224 [Pleurodeles waltl]
MKRKMAAATGETELAVPVAEDDELEQSGSDQDSAASHTSDGSGPEVTQGMSDCIICSTQLWTYMEDPARTWNGYQESYSNDPLPYSGEQHGWRGLNL